MEYHVYLSLKKLMKVHRTKKTETQFSTFKP